MAREGLGVEVRGLGGVRRLDAAAGQALLEAFLAAGLTAPHRCRQARCGRCRVYVAAGAEALEAPGDAERARLGAALGAGVRLMCQARVANRPTGAKPWLVVEY